MFKIFGTKEAKPKTLTECIKLHLEREGKIDCYEAMVKYGVVQLNSIIFELRTRHKMNISSNLVKSVNKYGITITYSIFRLC